MKLPLRRSVPLVVIACVAVATAFAVPAGLAVASRSAELTAMQATEAILAAHLDALEQAFLDGDVDAASRAIAAVLGDRSVRRAFVEAADGTIHCGDRLEDAGLRLEALSGLDGLDASAGVAVTAARSLPHPWLSGHLQQERVLGAVAIGPPGPDAPTLVIIRDMGPELFKVRHDTVATLGVFLVFVFLTAVVAGLAFQRLVGRRAAKLLAASHRVAAGDLETRTGVGGEDEVGVIAAAFDAMVTRLADRSEQIQRSEANYRQLFEQAVQPILVADATARILDVNGAGCALLEASADALKGRHLGEVLLGGEGGDAPPQTMVARRDLALPGGRRVPCEVAWRSLPDGRLLILARDLRAEQDAESLRQALVVHERLAALGTLAASVGHEINNPLTYLLANLRTSIEIIRGASLPPPMRAELDELLDDAVDGAERVRRIVADLNVFARPANAPAKVEVIDLREVAERAVSLARPALSEHCRVEVAEMGALPVLGDERRLAQIIINLLTNAAQAMPASRAREDNVVTLRARTTADRVVLEVTDNGVGMPEDIRSRVFEPFFTTRTGHGSGLGLSISRELAVSIGGDISVASRVGGGSTFSVRLRPAPPSGNGVGATVPPSEVATPSRGSRPLPSARVLVIDNEPRVAQALARDLEGHCLVQTATSVAEGLRVLEGGGIDGVVCDLSMPDGGARTLLARIGPAERDRVIVVTGGAQSREMSDFLEAAARPVLTKPIDRERLLALVAQVCPQAGS